MHKSDAGKGKDALKKPSNSKIKPTHSEPKISCTTKEECSILGIHNPTNTRYYSMLKHIRTLKVENAEFLSGHEITDEYRMKLVNWLCEVIQKCDLSDDTYFMTIKLMDTYFMHRKTPKEKVRKSELQLVGVACLFIANKYNDYKNMTADFIESKVVHKAFTEEDILKLEADVFTKIDEKLGTPYELTFIGLYVLLAEKEIGSEYIERCKEQSKKNLHSYILSQMDPEDLALGTLHKVFNIDDDIMKRISILSERSLDYIKNIAAKIDTEMSKMKLD